MLDAVELKNRESRERVESSRVELEVAMREFWMLASWSDEIML